VPHCVPLFLDKSIKNNTKQSALTGSDVVLYIKTYSITDNAKQYIGGVAWHGYSGNHDTPGAFHDTHPDVGKWVREKT